jgi:hypothetical protein
MGVGGSGKWRMEVRAEMGVVPSQMWQNPLFLAMKSAGGN